MIEHLLSFEFPGRDQLRQQLAVAIDHQEDDPDACVVMHIDRTAAPRTMTKYRIPVEAEWVEVDTTAMPFSRWLTAT